MARSAGMGKPGKQTERTPDADTSMQENIHPVGEASQAVAHIWERVQRRGNEMPVGRLYAGALQPKRPDLPRAVGGHCRRDSSARKSLSQKAALALRVQKAVRTQALVQLLDLRVVGHVHLHLEADVVAQNLPESVLLHGGRSHVLLNCLAHLLLARRRQCGAVQRVLSCSGANLPSIESRPPGAVHEDKRRHNEKYPWN